ncbi:hypothetical protein XELAEV_18012828mg [Xenopus laevis]|uniref:Uncharacterized protein n=1 Tax=Xenopus laevis TaxID=8355 RepID=A0A974DNB0_XENLA|nr:hypothetical protein XELAEV_18012828mg [Xenopus laevis]
MRFSSSFMDSGKTRNFWALQQNLLMSPDPESFGNISSFHNINSLGARIQKCFTSHSVLFKCFHINEEKNCIEKKNAFQQIIVDCATVYRNASCVEKLGSVVFPG